MVNHRLYYLWPLLRESIDQQSSQQVQADTVSGHKTMSTEELKEHVVSLGVELPVWSIIPFVGILLSIALFPLLAPHIWHHHFRENLSFLGITFAIPFLIAYKGQGLYGHSAYFYC